MRARAGESQHAAARAVTRAAAAAAASLASVTVTVAGTQAATESLARRATSNRCNSPGPGRCSVGGADHASQ